VGAGFDGSLTFREIEGPGDITKHPRAATEAKEKAGAIAESFLNRKKVLFVCMENACRSQMAGAFTRYYAGDRIEVESAGSTPAQEINPQMEDVMEEKGVDMAYIRPKSIEEVLDYMSPDIIVSMGCGEECPSVPGVEPMGWDLPDPAGKPIDLMRRTRNEIEGKVNELIALVDGNR